MKNCYDCTFMRGVHRVRKFRKGLIDYKEVKFSCVKGHIEHQKSGADRTFKFHVVDDGRLYKYKEWEIAFICPDFHFNGDAVDLEQIFPPTSKSQNRIRKNGKVQTYA